WILERLRAFPRLGGPEDRRPIAAATGQQCSVLREVERNTVARVSIQAVDQSARGDLPDLQRIGRTCSRKQVLCAETGDQIFPVRRKRQCTDHSVVLVRLEAG